MTATPKSAGVSVKACNTCGVMKDLKQFHPSETRDGRRNKCADCENKRRSVRRQKNLEKERARDRERYRTNPVRRLNTQRLRAANLERYKANDVRRHLADPRKKMLKAARLRAKAYGRECTIALTDIVIPKTCPLLGIPIYVGLKQVKNNSPTLDRKDSTKGYTPGNVWVISWRANRMKSDSTLEELKLFVKNWPVT
jgi:hypothetical protein